MIRFSTWNEQEVPTFSNDTETKGALEALNWAYTTYGDEIVYACSFGVEGILLIDLISKVKPDAKIVFLETGLHFKETYDLIKKVNEKYPQLKIEMKLPSLTLEEQANQFGEELWKREPNKCCNIRKILPLQEALKDAPAWISGLRREQSPARQKTNFVNLDQKFQSIKICPLIHWTWKEVWRYVYYKGLPYNPLHDIGYPSIGCEVCTLPAANTNDTRSGRWAGTSKTECGLHD